MWPLCKRLEVSPGFCLLAAWFALSSGWQALAVILLAIPQIEYRMDPKGYFLITEDYDAYKQYKGIKGPYDD